MTKIYAVIHNKTIKENEALTFSVNPCYSRYKFTGKYEELKIIFDKKEFLLKNAFVMLLPDKKHVATYDKLYISNLNIEDALLSPVMKSLQSIENYVDCLIGNKGK
jgi:hypothetical protein